MLEAVQVNIEISADGVEGQYFRLRDLWPDVEKTGCAALVRPARGDT